jgi:hypothetical protein
MGIAPAREGAVQKSTPTGQASTGHRSDGNKEEGDAPRMVECGREQTRSTRRKGHPVKAFLARHAHRILGTLSGFDRILFRGTLRTVSYLSGAKRFLSAKRILLRDFIAFAQECTEELTAHAKRVAQDAGRPCIYLGSSSTSKQDLAQEIAERDHIHKGLVCVLYAIEVCVSADVRRNREAKKLELVFRKRKCRFFYFYYMDREFGLMHVRVQSWFPFPMQVCLNGRSYLARQMDREGIAYEQRSNCFAYIEDLPRAQELLDRLSRRAWPKTLSRLAARVNPLLRSRLDGVWSYYWSVGECEVATDVVFRDREALGEAYPRLWEHAMVHFSTKDVMRFLGKKFTRAFSGESTTDVKHRPEGVRIRHGVHGNSIKMYDKEESVLRVETTITNSRWFRVLRRAHRQGRSTLAWLPMRKGVCDIARYTEVAVRANARYLEALAVVGDETPSHRVLDSVSQPVKKGRYRYRALHPASRGEARLFEALLQGQHLIRGVRNRDVQACLFGDPTSDSNERRRRSAYVSRKLRLLRAHGLLRKVARRQLYRITPKGQRVMTTALSFRRSHAPLLALPNVA